MHRTRSFAGALALSGALLTAMASGAHAWEADAVAGKLKSALDNQGFSIDWTAAEKEGGGILLSGVTLSGADSDDKAAIGDLTLEDIEEGDEAYTVGYIAVPDYQAKDENGTVSVSGVTFTGLEIPKQDEESAILHYRTAEMGGVTVTDEDGTQFFSLTNLSAEMTPPDDGTLSFTGSAESFTLDLAAMTKDDAKRARLEKLGYSQLTGNGSLAGSWNPSDGHLKLSDYSLTVEDAGTLHAMVDISGYTPEFIKSLRETREQIKNAGPDDKSAQGLAMLGLLQQLTFNGLSLKFDDDGFTDKALQMAAERQGTEPEQIANQIKGVIPLKLTGFLGTELTQDIAAAVGTFLDDPQNIAISAQPASPLPFAILAGAAMAAPDTLAKTLGLEVKANQ